MLTHLILQANPDNRSLLIEIPGLEWNPQNLISKPIKFNLSLQTLV